jgi:AcrR family transcriptional regulator
MIYIIYRRPRDTLPSTNSRHARAAIANLTRDLRLMQGGFYRHFDSREHLFAEAFAVGLEQVSERLVRAACWRMTNFLTVSHDEIHLIWDGMDVEALRRLTDDTTFANITKRTASSQLAW